MDPILWPLFIVVALVGVLFLLMPGLTRPDVFFAVTVEPPFRTTPEGRRAAALYRAVSLAASLFALAVLSLTAQKDVREVWAVSALLIQVAGATCGFLAARHIVRPHAVQPAATREAVMARTRFAPPGGWLLQAIPFGVLGAAAVVIARRWAELPARLPNHWNFAGEANGFVDKTLGAVAAQMVTAAFLCVLLAAAAAAIMQGRRVSATGEGASSEATFRAVAAGVLLVAELLIAVLLSQTAIQALFPSVARQQIVVVTMGAMALVLVLSAFMFWLGQGGSRRAPAPAGVAPVGDRTPDSAWVMGLFYVNRNDPALLVEKRFGIGYTLNFGHPLSWVLVGLALGAVVLALLRRH